MLVVDDTRVNLLVAERFLKLEGALTTTAGDGQQALEILRAQPGAFDVVLMDVRMPVMDGLTATRAIRADEQLKELPAVALTAGVLPEEREAALSAGMNDFLDKPLKIEQMVKVLMPFC